MARKPLAKALERKVDYRGRAGIPDHIKEGVIQMYAITPNKAECARTFGISICSVYKILGQKDPEELREKRRDAMGRIAGKMTDMVEVIVDDLATPPEDATYKQKATVLGIVTDKIEKLDKRLDEHKRDDAGLGFMMPENMDAMIGVIRNDLKSFGMVIGVRVVDDLLKEAASLEEQVGKKLLEVEGEVTKIDDLDVGGG